MLGRRTTASPDAAAAAGAGAAARSTAGGSTSLSAQGKERAAAESPPGSAGKGRPTPKRSEAERSRKSRAQAPRDRKEAARLARERSRAERAKMREALVSGDERHLPARDRGPVRRLVRDVVDSRRSVGEFFLFVALAVLVASVIRVPALQLVGTAVWLVLLPVLVLDSLLLARRLRTRIRERFPHEVERGQARGAVAYGLARSLQIRRLRLPKPRIKPGDPIPR